MNCDSFCTTISSSMDFKVLKPVLKDIYVLLCSYLSNDVDRGHYTNVGVKNGLKKLNFEDTTTLSSVLLNELIKKMSLTLHKVSSYQVENNVGDSRDEILLLLRCSCLMVWLHPHDQTVVKSFRDALALLRRLSVQLVYSQSDKPIDSSVRLVKQMLEVYLDEVFVERPFQECLAFSECISPNCQNLPMCSSMKIKSILEVVAIHFLLSTPGGHALQTFLENLISTEESHRYCPEFCLNVGLSLIKHPVVMSAPLIVHSHLISLVSDVIGTSVIPQMAKLNIRKSKVYLSEFYDAVILYSRQFSKLVNSSCIQLHTPGKSVHRVFNSLFQFEIFDKVNLTLVDMDCAWRSQIGEIASAGAISYVKMNIHRIDEIHRDYALTFMSSVISEVASTEIDELLLERTKGMKLEDVCLFASLLKLMSCSLLQAARYLKFQFSCLDSSSENKQKRDSSVFGIMNSFAQHKILPKKVQQLIVEGLKLGSSSYDDLVTLFVHFAGVLALFMNSRLDVLVKGCLIFMLTLLNILTRDEDASDFLRHSGSESSPRAISDANRTRTVMECTPETTFSKTKTKTSSMRTVSKFQQARMLLRRRRTSLDCSDDSDDETCNGEAFVKCFTNNSKDLAEFADFIECKKGKDYTSWLGNRGSFRYRRLIKRVKQRRLKMKKVCRSLGYQPR